MLTSKVFCYLASKYFSLDHVIFLKMSIYLFIFANDFEWYLYIGCKVKSWGGIFLCSHWSQTYTSNYKICLKNVKIYVMAFLNFNFDFTLHPVYWYHALNCQFISLFSVQSKYIKIHKREIPYIGNNTLEIFCTYIRME